MFLWFFTWYFSHTHSHWIFPITPWGRYSYHPCFIDEDLETERLGDCSRLQNSEVAEVGLQLRFCNSTFYAIFILPLCLIDTQNKQTKGFCLSTRTTPEDKNGKDNWRCTLYILSLIDIYYSNNFKPPYRVAQVCISSSGNHPELRNKTATFPSWCPTRSQI